MDSINHERRACFQGFAVLGVFLAFGAFLYFHQWLIPILVATGFFGFMGMLFAPVLLPESVRSWYQERQWKRKQQG